MLLARSSTGDRKLVSLRPSPDPSPPQRHRMLPCNQRRSVQPSPTHHLHHPATSCLLALHSRRLRLVVPRATATCPPPMRLVIHLPSVLHLRTTMQTQPPLLLVHSFGMAPHTLFPRGMTRERFFLPLRPNILHRPRVPHFCTMMTTRPMCDRPFSPTCQILLSPHLPLRALRPSRRSTPPQPSPYLLALFTPPPWSRA